MCLYIYALLYILIIHTFDAPLIIFLHHQLYHHFIVYYLDSNIFLKTKSEIFEKNIYKFHKCLIRMHKKGLFQFIRETSFTKFLLAWIISIFVFGIIYWILSAYNTIIINGQALSFTILGFFNGLYASLLIALVFGLGIITHEGIVTVIVYLQLLISGILFFILADKIIIKYIHPYYHITHHQDRKINTLMIMMSVFRTDSDRIMHEYATRKKQITIKDIESIIDGLYVVFLDVEKLFSEKNIHRHKISKIQYLMLTENIEDSLHKLESFILFMERHNIEWKDKSITFWMRYILETTEKIAHNIANSDIKSHKIILAVENIKAYAEKIKAKM